MEFSLDSKQIKNNYTFIKTETIIYFDRHS